MSEVVTKDMAVNDAIKQFPNTIGVFTDFGIDSCCGGASSIEDAASRDGADLNTLLNALNKAAIK
jgi:regulator of cell morphogenesis and NO signaling